MDVAAIPSEGLILAVLKAIVGGGPILGSFLALILGIIITMAIWAWRDSKKDILRLELAKLSKDGECLPDVKSELDVVLERLEKASYEREQHYSEVRNTIADLHKRIDTFNDTFLRRSEYDTIQHIFTHFMEEITQVVSMIKHERGRYYARQDHHEYTD